MQRIDAVLAGNSYTWLKFRGKVVRRADGAMAALAKRARGP